MTTIMESGIALEEQPANGAAYENEQLVEVVDYGMLTDGVWRGKVSAKNMIESGETTQSAIDTAAQRINEFYVPVGTLAVTRCIDGRHDPNISEDNLGPQVPGGVAGAALAYKIGVEDGDVYSSTFYADASAMIKTFLRRGLPLGGHRDEHSEHHEDTVGCGLIDAMDVLVGVMADPALHYDHKQTTQHVLGGGFDRDVYMRNMGVAGFVHATSGNYFRGRQRVLDTVERHTGGSPVLEGEHKEGLFVVNDVPPHIDGLNGKTLSSNRFADEFAGMQAFGYDLWRSRQMAEKILPGSENAEKRHRFISARVMTTVATIMALTDGSQRFLVRRPIINLEEVA